MEPREKAVEIGSALAEVERRQPKEGASQGGFEILRGANLEGAVMARTRLMRANLEDAVLADADLSDARLNGANLSGVVWVNTRCPDGTVSDHHGDTCCEHLDGAVPSAGCDPMASE